MKSTDINNQAFAGIVSVSALVRAAETGVCRRKILRILIGKERIRTDRRRVEFIKAASSKLGIPLEFTDETTIDSIAGTDSHGGFLAEATPAAYPGIESVSPLKYPFSVLLDGIEDPYSLGHAARVLYCCGADAIILPRLPFASDATVCRASAGAFELLPVFLCDSADAAAAYRRAGVRTVAAGIRDSVDIGDADLSLPMLLICGGEKRGISSAVSEQTDLTVRIPYARPFRGSLPAETAVSVFAYEIMKANRLKMPCENL